MSKRFILSTLFVLSIVGGYLIFRNMRSSGARSLLLRQWFRSPESRADLTIMQGEHCGDAPFIMPTNGVIGYLWDDSFRPGHRHQGLDIFGGEGLNVTPVIAAYDGYLSRLPDWTSTVIMRATNDPLQTATPSSTQPSRAEPAKFSSKQVHCSDIRAITQAIPSTQRACICTLASSSMMAAAPSATNWRSRIRSIPRHIWEWI